MAQRVELPGGEIAEFPDDMSQEQIQSALKKRQGPKPEKVEKAVDTAQEEMETAEPGSVSDTLYNIGANLNLGLTRLFGMPGSINEALTGGHYLPTQQELQKTLSDYGMTYKPGEEPQDLGSRVLQEVGTVGVPLVGTFGRGASLARQGVQKGKGLFEKGALATARRPGTTAVAETGAVYGAAGGGKIGEQMWEDNPVMGRAVGELIGGLGGGFIATGGPTGSIVRMGKRISPFTKEAGRGRAVRRVSRGTVDPHAAKRNIEESSDIAEETGDLLSPAQRSNDPYLAELEKAVRAENDMVRENLVNSTAEASKKLKEIAYRTGDVEDMRLYLDKRMNLATAKAYKSAAAVRGRPAPETIATRTRKLIEDAYTDARDAEKRVWKGVPSDLTVKPSSAKSAWKEELEDITKGADKSEIPSFIREKLGTLNKKGELTGGGLGKNPSAKALHQFYSSLGRKLRSEEDTKGFNTNTIRIMKKVRQSVLEDLEDVDGGEEYRKAIEFSRDLNEKFTKGPVGEVLGIARAGGPTNTTETMEALMGMSGEKQRNAVKQLLKATPRAEEQVKDFIRSRFVDASFEDGKINPNNATKFINKYRPVLREFPDLRNELLSSTKDQKVVDSLVGASDYHQFSNAVKQKKSAGVFLQAEPGEEIARVIGATKGKPKSKTAAFEELVSEVKEDETGRAYEGLKRAVAEYTMAPSNVEDAQGELLINGKKMLDRINEIETSLINSGTMKRDEINRLKKIGRIFEGIQKTETGRGSAEGVIGDKPDMIMNALARILSVQAGRAVPSGGSGASIQTANIASNIGRKLAEKLTATGARKLLVDAVQEEDTMDTLLTRVNELGVKEKEKLIQRVLNKLPRVPQSATVPAAATATEAQQGEQ